MYLSITEDIGVEACKDYLNSRDFSNLDEELKVKTENILEALNLCIKNNYFKFNNNTYRVKEGVGIGQKVAPPYACLGVGKFESLAFNSDCDLCEKILLWKRFIDDIFMLFEGTEQQCKDLVNWLNSLMPGVIKFTYEYSLQKIEFLDLEISKKDGKLATNLYIKPNNQQLYLDFNSNHPLPCKEGIVYGQALRIVERCSSDENRDTHLTLLSEKLRERNYPPKVIENEFQKAKSKPRKQLLSQRRVNRNDGKKVRLLFTHNKNGPPLHKWVRDAKKLLLRNHQAKDLGDKIQISYKQPKNLKSLLAGPEKRPKISKVPNAGCYRCNSCRVSCPIIKEGKTFTSTNTSRTYQIKQKLDCNSSYVIYLATCLKCSGQYVGKSQTSFKTRHSNHKQEVKKCTGGLGRHFGGQRGCGYNSIYIQIIDQVEEGAKSELAQRENFWQHQLRAYIQNGGNACCLRKDV